MVTPMSARDLDGGPRSRTEWAEDRLRQAIITGALAPGERIFVEQLAAEWRLSATPLREALRTLAGQGLIVLDAQRGAKVSEVSVPEMLDVYELRLIVEPYALRLSIERDDPAWRAELERSWQALRRAHGGSPKSPIDLEPAHTDFHVALVAGCGSELLTRTTTLLATQALRFRTLIAPRRPGGNKQSSVEHRRLRDLALGGQADEAAASLATHLSWPLSVAVAPELLAEQAERLAVLRPDLVIRGLGARGDAGR
jgi:DNA-binding GntR family transcriptional regulator